MHKSLLRQAREGFSAVLGMVGLRAVIFGSGAMLLAAGLFNVAELPFVRDDLDGGNAGFSILIGLYGVGFVGGLAVRLEGRHARRAQAQVAGRPGGGERRAGLPAGRRPTVFIAGLAFALAGVGNGLVLVYERLLIQIDRSRSPDGARLRGA